MIDALGVGGGAEHSLVAMLPLLAERGVESEVVCLIPREGGLQVRVQELGFRVDVVPPGRFPSRAAWLRSRLRASEADLLHASLVSSCLLARVAGAGAGVPQVNSLVQTTYDRHLSSQAAIPAWKLRALAVVDGFTARHFVDRVHTLTAAVTAEATDVLGIDPERIVEIPRGRSAAQLGECTPDRRGRVRQSLGLGDDVPVVLNVARQDQQKGQALLVRAFAEVLVEHPDAVLLIAGREGNASAQLRAEIHRTGVERSVRVLGHRADVPDLLAAADVFAFPSISEGFGGAVIEAMALDTPVVASDHPALTEVLGNGRYGVVTRRGDPASLAVGIAGVLDDPVRATELAHTGRARFAAVYELDRVVDRMVVLYRGVAESRD